MGGVWHSHVPPIHTNKIASFLSLCYTCPRRNKRREPFIVASDTSNMQNPFIVGERIYLRPLEPAQDNHLYSTWMNDEEIRRYFSIYPTSDTRGKERLEQLYKDGKHIIFGVSLNSDNRLIGLVGLKDINYINQSAEFYVIIGNRSVWVHMVVFGGFAASALRDRIIDCDAKVLITADGSYRGGKVIELKHIADEAIAETPTIQKSIVVRHTGMEVPMKAGRDIYMDDLLADIPEATVVPCEPMDSEDLLYILYTSGSTGKPKGVVHVQGGHAVGVYATTKLVFDIKPSDVYWCTADVGWVTGHSYMVYGPLMNGATSVQFEG